VRTAVAAGLAASLLTVSACADDGGLPPAPDDASAVLVGKLGPGAPSDGELPSSVELVFTGPGGAVRTAVARDGEYEIVLPEGTWDVRAEDGQTCGVGLVADGGTSQRADLVYPTRQCLSLAPPDGPPAPPPPPPPPPPG
jgi:hypothetical protein